jgi:hypothetical protein
MVSMKYFEATLKERRVPRFEQGRWRRFDAELLIAGIVVISWPILSRWVYGSQKPLSVSNMLIRRLF